MKFNWLKTLQMIHCINRNLYNNFCLVIDDKQKLHNILYHIDRLSLRDHGTIQTGSRLIKSLHDATPRLIDVCELLFSKSQKDNLKLLEQFSPRDYYSEMNDYTIFCIQTMCQHIEKYTSLQQLPESFFLQDDLSWNVVMKLLGFDDATINELQTLDQYYDDVDAYLSNHK